MDFRVEYGKINVLMRYTGKDEDVVVPDDVDTIKCMAFFGRKNMKTVTIANRVSVVCDEAFSDCDRLQSITFGKSVTTIGKAVDCCDNLKEILVQPGNPVYHSAGNCLIDTKKKELVLGCQSSILPTDSSVTTIGDRAFLRCENLNHIDIPDTVTSIRERAFERCAGLTEIRFGKGLRTIGRQAFSWCTHLEEIVLPPNVTVIEKEAFSTCYNLRSVTIPDDLFHIGKYAFFDCDNLREIHYTGNIPILKQVAMNADLGHWIFRHPSNFHPEDIRYCWEHFFGDLLDDDIVFSDWRFCMAEDFVKTFSREELLNVENCGLITKENGARVLEMFRKMENVECTSELVRYLSHNRILGDFMEKFALELEEEEE